MNEKNIPHHVAIILDGNGRWAKKEDNQDHLDIIWVEEIFLVLQDMQEIWALKNFQSMPLVQKIGKDQKMKLII